MRHQPTHRSHFAFWGIFLLALALIQGCACEFQPEFAASEIQVPVQDTIYPALTAEILVKDGRCPVMLESVLCDGKPIRGSVRCDKDIDFEKQPFFLWVRATDGGGLAGLEISLIGGEFDRQDTLFTYTEPMQKLATWKGERSKALDGKAYYGLITPEEAYGERISLTIRARDYTGNETLIVWALKFPLDKIRKSSPA
ncbi:MAG: hypothetical protein H6581_04655 [Bacteroidia bacterium]|nr:hypothetical protein [Bacteroidia bacterium]